MYHGTVICGTTPEHEFELPYPADAINKIRIVYGQKNKPIFTKTEKDCKFIDGKALVNLSQKETFMFSAGKPVCIEIRIKLVDGSVVRSEEPILLEVIDSMDKEVID